MSTGLVMLWIALALQITANVLNHRDLRLARREQGHPAWGEVREERPAPWGLQAHDRPKVQVRPSPLSKSLTWGSLPFLGLAFYFMFSS